MKSITSASFLVTVAISIYFIYFEYCLAQKNTVAFERAECVTIPNSGFSVNKCKAKMIRRDRLSAYFNGYLNRTVTSVFMHYRVYYKFSTNEYRPLFIDVWEDFCAYMNGAKNNIVLSRMFPELRQFVNFNHTCPYHPGFMIINMSNISLDVFTPVQFVPSGRYRVDVSAYDGYKGKCICTVKSYGSVSDYRVETF